MDCLDWLHWLLAWLANLVGMAALTEQPGPAAGCWLGARKRLVDGCWRLAWLAGWLLAAWLRIGCCLLAGWLTASCR